MARRVFCFVGVAATILLAVGALGPWVNTEVGTLSGLDGLGWPLLLAALVAGCLFLGGVLGPIRWGLLPALLIGIAVFLAWAAVITMLGAASKSAHLLSLLADAEWESEALAGATRVERGWGLDLVAVSSVALVVSSVFAIVLRPERAAAPAGHRVMHRAFSRIAGDPGRLEHPAHGSADDLL